MKFALKPVTPAEIERLVDFFDDSTGHLLIPALEFFWQVQPDDTARLVERARWSAEVQKDQLLHDPTMRFVQVIDEDANNEPVALGTWHDYPAGSQRSGDYDLAGVKDPNDPAMWPSGFDKDSYLGDMGSLLRAREEWMASGRCWVLTTVCTRHPYRRQGAAGLILDWGLDEARKLGVPAYLEAVPDAKSLYEKHGFREVDVQDFVIAGHPVQVSRMRCG